MTLEIRLNGEDKRLKTESLWPKAPTYWQEGRTLCVSVPFSWSMPAVRDVLRKGSFDWDRAIIGGSGAYLVQHFYPAYLDGLPVEIGESYPGVLQRVNPQATRSTTGCIRQCGFCGIGQRIIEGGGMCELDDWPDLPIYCDNNLLASSNDHFSRIIERLQGHGWGDFEQGIDSRLLTDYHAKRIAEIQGLIVRLALDSLAATEAWAHAYDLLRAAGIAKYRIRSYALIGFDSDPTEAWERCKWIEGHGVRALPMWFHRLDALDHNIVTTEQAQQGWNDYERRRIMQFYYQHKQAVLY